MAVCASGSTVDWWYGTLADSSWTDVAQIPAGDSRASRPVAFSDDGRALFATSSVGRDTVALVSLRVSAWTPTVLSACDGFDITAVLMAPDGNGPDLVTTTDPDNPQLPLTEAAAADLARLQQVADGAPAWIIDRNDSHCLAEVCYPVGGRLRHVRPDHDGREQAARQVLGPRESADTAPRSGHLRGQGRPPHHRILDQAGGPPWPAVLVIHGGPWSRDSRHGSVDADAGGRWTVLRPGELPRLARVWQGIPRCRRRPVVAGDAG